MTNDLMQANLLAIFENQKVVLAVSGGLDSMVLLDLFRRQAPSLNSQFLVASVNHGMRPESQEDVALVANYCQKYGLGFVTNSDIPQGLASEEAARQYRYAFLEKVVEEAGATYLVTAHHLDDQVETSFLHLVRGKGLRSIAGMPQKRSFGKGAYLIRPLLGVSKQTLLDYAQAEQLPFNHDASNDLPLYLRNRLRTTILPALREENPQFNQQIHNFQEDLGAVLEVANRTIQSHLASLLTTDGWLDLKEFRSLPEADQGLVLASWLERFDGLSRPHVKKLQALIAQSQGEKIYHLSAAWQYRQVYDKAIIESRESRETADREVLRWLAGQPSPLAGLSLSQSTEQAYGFVVESDWPLTIRTYEPGDRLDLGGFHKKVSRLFIDCKIPKGDRQKIKLILNQAGLVIAILDLRLQELSKRRETGKIDKTYFVYRKRD